MNSLSQHGRSVQKIERGESSPACERGAVDDQRCSVHLTHDPAKIREQISAEIRFDQRAPAVRGEDHVEQDVS